MKKRKKEIFIFAYFFPLFIIMEEDLSPSSVKYFRKFVFYSIVIKRNWDVEIKSLLDLRLDKFDTHEVYYISFKRNIRDRLYVKYGNQKFSLLILVKDRFYLSISEFLALVTKLLFAPNYNSCFDEIIKYFKVGACHRMSCEMMSCSRQNKSKLLVDLLLYK